VVLAISAAMLAAGCAGGAPRASSAPAATRTPATSSVPAATQRAITATPAALLDLDGTYRYTLTQEDADAADDPEAGDPDQYPQTTTVVLEDGKFEGGCFGAAGGTYEIDGDQITFHSIEYDADSTVTFSVDAEGNLHLTPVPPMDPGDAFQCFSKPWTKIT
jgi:hypothetical protein